MHQAKDKHSGKSGAKLGDELLVKFFSVNDKMAITNQVGEKFQTVLMPIIFSLGGNAILLPMSVPFGHRYLIIPPK